MTVALATWDNRSTTTIIKKHFICVFSDGVLTNDTHEWNKKKKNSSKIKNDEKKSNPSSFCRSLFFPLCFLRSFFIYSFSVSCRVWLKYNDRVSPGVLVFLRLVSHLENTILSTFFLLPLVLLLIFSPLLYTDFVFPLCSREKPSSKST